jgi:hypothetical protein
MITSGTTMMMVTSTKPTANALLEEIKCLVSIERSVKFHMHKAFEGLVKERPVTPIEILRDGEVASNLAQGLFNEGTDSMGRLSENGVNPKDALRIAKALLQMNCEM